MTVTDSLIFCVFMLIVFFGVVGTTFVIDKREEAEEIFKDDEDR